MLQPQPQLNASNRFKIIVGSEHQNMGRRQQQRRCNTIGRYLNREPHEPQLEDGETYDATISKVEDEDGVETQWGERDRYIITFDVRDGTRLVELKGRYNKSMWPKSNYFKLLTTLDPDHFDGIRYDADDLVDKPCRVLIEHTKDDIGGVWDNISNVLKPKKASTLVDM